MSMKLSCKEILDCLSEYVDEELDTSICDQIENHMSGCSPCESFLSTLKKTVTLYNTSGEKVEIPEDVHNCLHEFLKNQGRPWTVFASGRYARGREIHPPFKPHNPARARQAAKQIAFL